MHMSLSLDTLPTRRDEAWKWTDVRGRVSDDIAGLSVAGLPKFTLPEGVTVSEVDTDDLDTDSAMAKLARNFGGKVWTIAVPEGFNSDAPLIIEGLNRGHIRIRIDIAKGASLNVIEHHAGDVGGFVNIDIASVSPPPILRRGMMPPSRNTRSLLAGRSRGLKRALRVWVNISKQLLTGLICLMINVIAT